MLTSYMVIDTETNGLPDYKLAADDPAQPRLAALAIIVAQLDEKGDGEIVTQRTMLVRPDGWSMQPEAQAVNHLTDEQLMAEGQPVKLVADLYAAFILDRCVVAAFNAQHDCKVMRGELRRLYPDQPDRDLFEQTKNTCLMRAWGGKGVPKANGKGGFPQLGDVFRSLFGTEMSDRHTAMGDAAATLAILQETLRRGLLIPPTVHYAKAKGDDAPKSHGSRGPGF